MGLIKDILTQLKKTQQEPPKNLSSFFLCIFNFFRRGSERLQDRSYSPMEWLVEGVVHPEVADTLPLVAIEDSEILGMIGQRTESKPTLSFKDLLPYLDKIESEAGIAEQVEARGRSRYQRDIIALKSKLVGYTQPDSNHWF